jgi:hypothetical protein
MRTLAAVMLLAALADGSALAKGKGPQPEDYLKGRILTSDRGFPMHWSSVSSYVSQMKGLNRSTLWYDKKTGKIKIYYAAFFAQPLNDVQVDLVIYDVTNGAHDRKAATEQFMNRGDRVLFNSVEFDKEDFEMNKKYLLSIVSRGKTIASGDFILRGEGPHYSGKVTFSEEEAKQKD